MARERMVTRTITSTLVTVMQVNTETAEVTNKNYNISSIFNDDAKLLRAVKKLYETEEVKIVAIVDKQVFSDLYGMTENDFLTHAHIIPKKEAKGENKQVISDLYGMTENDFLTHAHIIPKKEAKGEN